jgi:glutamate-1-semialdehyde 2,1-aminomutase
VAGYFLIPVVQVARLWGYDSLNAESFSSILPNVAQQWFLLTLAAVLGRVLYLNWAHNFRTSMIWFVKLITDPITDIFAYYNSVDKIMHLPPSGRSEATH